MIAIDPPVRLLNFSLASTAPSTHAPTRRPPEAICDVGNLAEPAQRERSGTRTMAIYITELALVLHSGIPAPHCWPWLRRLTIAACGDIAEETHMTHRGMNFGIFLAPFHRVGENPTLALARDAELIQWLDHLGYDEAWIGEHHSAGWELIALPPLVIAQGAERTKNIKLRPRV